MLGLIGSTTGEDPLKWGPSTTGFGSEFTARADRDLSVGGPGLAAHAIRAGLVDEFQFFVVPIIVGGGTRALPDHARITLSLLEKRSFTGGVVYLRYRVGA